MDNWRTAYKKSLQLKENTNVNTHTLNIFYRHIVFSKELDLSKIAMKIQQLKRQLKNRYMLRTEKGKTSKK